MLRDRRAFFGICAAGAAAGFGWLYGEFLPEESDIAPPGPPKMVSVVDFSDSGAREGIRTVPQILKSDREWRRHLTYTSFVITRKGGTELPYTGKYWNYLTQERIGRFTTKDCIAVSVAEPLSSQPILNSIPAQAGQVSGRQSRKKTSQPRKITRSKRPALRFPAAAAMLTWVMSSRMARNPPGSGTV